MDDKTENHVENKLVTLARHLIFRIRGMLSIEPIIGNVIAIALAIGILALLNHHEFFPGWLHGKWGLYLGYVVQAGIVIHHVLLAVVNFVAPVF